MREFFVAMIPTGKERPRKAAGGGFYTPPKTRDAENYIADCYRVACIGKQPYTGQVSVHIDVFKPLPQKSRAEAYQPFTCKPDIDNCAKLVLDALNGVAYLDDSQVNVLSIVKHDRERDQVAGFGVRLDSPHE